MLTCEIVLAAALLTAPSDMSSCHMFDTAVRNDRVVAINVGGIPNNLVKQQVNEFEAWLQILRPSILILAIDAELLDPRERAFLLTQDAMGDMALLQSRRADLRNAPLMGEGQRFPDRKLINAFLEVNRRYRNDMNARLTIDVINADDIRMAIAETDQLYQAWDTVRDANCDYYYVTVRRQALALLRELIGPEAFYSGRLPPHVPIWHFPRE